jgi:hypothetical protein
VVGRTDGATQPVHEGAMGFVVDRVAPTFGRMGGDEFGQNLGDRRGVVISGDLGVASHRGLDLKLKKKNTL